jgi:uncharacterized membrane protein YhaH (DUF805 family)
MRGGPWVVALVLIGLGAMLLVQQYTDFDLGRWWGLLFLIPAVGASISAWNAFRAGEDGQALTALVGALISLGLAATLLFDLALPWRGIWPALLILAGVGLLLRRQPAA